MMWDTLRDELADSTKTEFHVAALGIQSMVDGKKGEQ